MSRRARRRPPAPKATVAPRVAPRQDPAPAAQEPRQGTGPSDGRQRVPFYDELVARFGFDPSA